MCGISGGYNLSVDTVLRMTDHQQSRGPDNAGLHVMDRVIFGHNRLAIVDKSPESNQPKADSRSMLCYNGEIYNLTGFASDTLALRYALLGWTDDQEDLKETLNTLNGMFAFAYFDGVNIVLVRDRLGIKPLYYKKTGDKLAFASTPAAVNIALPGVMSQEGLQEYLCLGGTMLHSMFDGILAVPPGHYVIFNTVTEEMLVERWYYPKFVPNAAEVIEGRVLQAIDRVKLSCDEPQIVLLSGGIDSTLVASRYSGQKAIHLLSPEIEYAQTVADRFGLELIHANPMVESAEECLNDYVSKSGEPTMAGLIPYITCKEIKKQGFRVAITANGADELFYGYDRMRGPGEVQIAAIFRNFPFLDDVLAMMDMNYPCGFTFSLSQMIEIYSYLSFDLNKTLDFASMCHSVEVRVPYLDHQLLEAAISLSADEHVGRYGNKTILKKMLLDLGFDFSFIHRPKVGFSLHANPADWSDLGVKAMRWYQSSGLPQLPAGATPRQESYHQSAVTGLYLWVKQFA